MRRHVVILKRFATTVRPGLEYSQSRLYSLQPAITFTAIRDFYTSDSITRYTSPSSTFYRTKSSLSSCFCPPTTTTRVGFAAGRWHPPQALFQGTWAARAERRIPTSWSGSKRHISADKNTRSKPNPSASESTEDAGESNKNLLPRLPHIHRPTKEELLAAATGFWHRLGIRFKWLTIRSARPFNTDEIYALASWVFFGHIVWIIVGTTTFFSLAILAVNTVFAQETCLLYTSPSPRDGLLSRMPSSA